MLFHQSPGISTSNATDFLAPRSLTDKTTVQFIFSGLAWQSGINRWRCCWRKITALAARVLSDRHRLKHKGLLLFCWRIICMFNYKVNYLARATERTDNQCTTNYLLLLLLLVTLLVHNTHSPCEERMTIRRWCYSAVQQLPGAVMQLDDDFWLESGCPVGNGNPQKEKCVCGVRGGITRWSLYLVHI